MHDHSVIPRPGEAPPPPSWWVSASPEISSLEQHASEGCSICARALVNGRETAVDLALAAPRVLPSRAARAALLDRTRAALRERGTAPSIDGAGPQASGKSRLLDPSAVVAHKHLADPADAARIAEIDALRATEPRPGEGSARMLAQLARFLDFPLFFVSIVRGERATYRVQRGLPESLSAFRELRRDMSYCTHCMSGEAPLLVENALVEPFFRGNKAVTRFGVAAYAGAPLRTSRGIVIGTLCALDFKPRVLSVPMEPRADPDPGAAGALHAATADVLAIFARRAVAEIERERTPELLPAVIERASDRADLHAAPFFRDLVAAELSRSSPTGASALITLRVREGAARRAPAAVLDLLDEHETAGRIDATSFGLLLPGVGPRAAAARFARLGAASRDVTLGLAFAPAGSSSAGEWITSASHAR